MERRHRRRVHVLQTVVVPHPVREARVEPGVRLPQRRRAETRDQRRRQPRPRAVRRRAPVDVEAEVVQLRARPPLQRHRRVRRDRRERHQLHRRRRPAARTRSLRVRRDVAAVLEEQDVRRDQALDGGRRVGAGARRRRGRSRGRARPLTEDGLQPERIGRPVDVAVLLEVVRGVGEARDRSPGSPRPCRSRTATAGWPFPLRRWRGPRSGPGTGSPTPKYRYSPCRVPLTTPRLRVALLLGLARNSSGAGDETAVGEYPRGGVLGRERVGVQLVVDARGEGPVPD